MAKQEATATGTEDAIVAVSLSAVVLVVFAAAWMFLMPSDTPDFAAHIYWYLGRSVGLVAYWLLFGSVALGIAVSSRVFDGLLGRPWVFEVHKFLSIFVLLAMLFHVLILLPDPWAKFTLVEMFVPFKSHYRPTPVALGTIAFYGSLIVTASFYLKKYIGGQKSWRWLHYATFGLFIMALLHGLLSGTDSERPIVQYSYLASGVATLFLVFFRILATRAYGGKPRAERPAVPRATPAAAKPAPQPAAPVPAAVSPPPVVAQAVAQPPAQAEVVSTPAPQPVAPAPAAVSPQPVAAPVVMQPAPQPEALAPVPVSPQPVVAQAVTQPAAQPEVVSPQPAPQPEAPAPVPVSPQPVADQIVTQPAVQPEAVSQPPAPHPEMVSPQPAPQAEAPAPAPISPQPVADQIVVQPVVQPEAVSPPPVPQPEVMTPAPVSPQPVADPVEAPSPESAAITPPPVAAEEVAAEPTAPPEAPAATPVPHATPSHTVPSDPREPVGYSLN